MFADPYVISSIQAARRCEAELKIAQWHLIHSLYATHRTRQALRGWWPRLRWLARFRERRVLRARLSEYVAW